MWFKQVVWLLVLLSSCNEVLSQDIDPNQVEDEYSISFCLSEGKSLLIKDPFPPEMINSLIILQWVHNGDNGTTTDLLEILPNGEDPKVQEPRASVYQTLGLQYDDVTMADAGQYLANLLATSAPRTVIVNVAMAEAPELKSEQLSVSRTEDKNTGLVHLSCGTVESLGDPPVKLVWKAPNSTVIDGVYKNGNLTLSVFASDEEEGPFVCELDSTTSPAVECLAAEHLSRWEGSYVQPVATSASGNTTIIVVIVVVCILGIIIIVVISVLLHKRCKQGENYNTKHEEGKMEGGPGPGPNMPLMVQDDANPYDRPNARAGEGGNVIFKPSARDRFGSGGSGGNTASPYMVSGINMPESGDRRRSEPDPPPPKRNKAPVASIDNADGLGRSGEGNGKAPGGRYIKRNASRDGELGDKSGSSDVDGKEPPTPKKRSIFLTESNEALNKINEAVAGGIGSGKDGGRASESAV